MLLEKYKKKKDLIKTSSSPSLKETKNKIEEALRKSYYLNRSEKRIYSILLWAVKENEKIHQVSYAQISAETINKIIMKRYQKPKGYNISTISRIIRKLKLHNMLKTERGRDNINRYCLIESNEWLKEIESKKATIKSNTKSNTESYELFEEKGKSEKEAKLNNKYIYKYNIHTKRELDNKESVKKEQIDNKKEKDLLYERCKKYMKWEKEVKHKKINNENIYLKTMYIRAKAREWNFDAYEEHKKQQERIARNKINIDKNRELYLSSIENEIRKKAESKTWINKVKEMKEKEYEKYKNYRKKIKIKSETVKRSEEIIDILISEKIKEEMKVA